MRGRGYAGTGFVVGQGLLMTNRHVAQIFCGGLGLRDLVFLPGREASVDFRREKGSTEANILAVHEVLMIHPYWDLALLRADGPGADHPPLSLALTQPEEIAQKQFPNLTEAQAFTRAFEDPRNAELARLVHQPPIPTTDYPEPVPLHRVEAQRELTGAAVSMSFATLH
jgi:hypothetical protein